MLIIILESFRGYKFDNPFINFSMSNKLPIVRVDYPLEVMRK